MALKKKKKKGQTDTRGNRVREVRENVQETSEIVGGWLGGRGKVQIG